MSTSTLYVAAGLFLLVVSWFVIPLKWMALLSWLARLLTGLRRKKVDVEGVSWQYLEGGKKGGTNLVILHGLAAEADHWLGVAGPLRKDFHLIMPDLPGFGGSQHPKGMNFTIQEQSRRLEAWLDTIGVKDCVIAGNSMGAWISADFAARNPDRVKALWLEDAFGVKSAQRSEVMQEFEQGDSNPFTVNSMTDYKNLVGLMFFKPPHVPYALARAGYLNTYRLKDELPRMQKEFLLESTPMEDLVTGLTMPVLIEWGEEDRATHPDGARVLKELIPHATVETYPDCGHLPMLECPTACAQTFKEFAELHRLAD